MNDIAKPPPNMPHNFARQSETITRLQADLSEAKRRIAELTKALDEMNERQRKEWARAENVEAWGQRAYAMLEYIKTIIPDPEIASMLEIGVNDEKIAALLQDAPDSVKEGAQ